MLFVNQAELERELDKLDGALHLLARETGKDFGEIVRKESRIVAVCFAIGTQPFSGSEGNFKSDNPTYTGAADRLLGEQAVLRDVGFVYRTIDQVYAQIQTQSKNQFGGGERAAKLFYACVMNGEMQWATQLLRRLNIFDSAAPLGKFDKGAAHQQRRNQRGRVGGGKRASIIITDPKKLVTYVKKIQRRVGFAKGGWAAAARQIGGTRGMPQWVTRHKNAPGSATDNSRSSNNPHVILHNRVSYINAVFSAKDEAIALRSAQGRIEKQVRIIVAKNARKAGFLAAA
jgi:hypothetical protein